MSAREDILQKVWTTARDVTEENPTLDVPMSWSDGAVAGDVRSASQLRRVGAGLPSRRGPGARSPQGRRRSWRL